MVEPNLVCNYPKCKKPLTGNVSVTRCSHIFCSHHPFPREGERRCPACTSVLEGNYDVVDKNLHITEEKQTKLLYGYTPEMVFQAMSNGIQFWEYQRNNHMQHLRKERDFLRSHLAQREAAMQTMELHFKNLINIQENKIKNLKKEIRTFHEAQMELDNKLNVKNRQLRELQTRYDCLQGRFTATRLSQNIAVRDAEMERLRTQHIRFGGGAQTHTQSQTGFVFRPNTPRPASRTSYRSPSPQL